MPQVSLEREIRALKLEVVRLKALVDLRNEEVDAAEGNVREARESIKLLRSEVKRMENCLKEQGEKWRDELEDNLRMARETTHASCELLRSQMERETELCLKEREEQWKKEQTQAAKKSRKQEYQRKVAHVRSICNFFGWDNAFGKQKEKGWAACLTGRANRLYADLLDAALGF